MKTAFFDPSLPDIEKSFQFQVELPKVKDFITPGTRRWPKLVACRKEGIDLRCLVKVIDNNFYHTFILTEDLDAVSAPLKMRLPTVHYNIPDAVDSNPQAQIFDGFLMVDMVIITRHVKKKYLVFYQLPDRSRKDVSVQSYAWYSIEKNTLFSDFSKEVQIIPYGSKEETKLLVSCDGENYSFGVYELNQKLQLQNCLKYPEVNLAVCAKFLDLAVLGKCSI